MNKDERTPKVRVNSRGFYEEELVENLKNTEDFQHSVDLYQEGRLDKVSVSFKEKQEQKEHIIINSEGVTREIDNNTSDPEVREKITEDMKKKYKIKDCYPVKSYSYRE